MATLIDGWKAELEAVRAAKRDLMNNGQTVSIQGSHSYTKVTLAELNREETRLMRLIAAACGISSRKTEIPRYE